MSKKPETHLLYDPEPKKDLELPPMINREVDQSTGSLAKEKDASDNLKERIGNLELRLN